MPHDIHKGQKLLESEIKSFIRDHRDADIKALALKKPPYDDWPYPLILDQIKARQKAARKFPEWLEREDTLFPSADTIEQASSSPTARYKAALAQQYGARFIDLTGGSGADSFALLEAGLSGTYVDLDEFSCFVAAHNARLWSMGELDVTCADSMDYAQTMKPTDIVLIDPQRRDNQRKGKFRLDNCSPDIKALLPVLRDKARYVMLKTSPMLDIHHTIEALQKVCAVHVLEWQNECKELLFILDLSLNSQPDNSEMMLHAVDLSDTNLKAIECSVLQAQAAEVSYALPAIGDYIYEPSAAFQKAGLVDYIAQLYQLRALHPHTKLLCGSGYIDNFPGRVFNLEALCPPKAKALKPLLPDMKASLTVRNFPMNTETLRAKLKIKDGGAVTVFACTLKNEQKTLMLCKKARAL